MAEEIIETTPQQEPAPVPQPSPAPSPAPAPTPSFNLREYAANQFGQPELAKQYDSDEKFAAQLVDLARQTATYAQKAQLADRYAPHQAEFDNWLAEREKAKEAEQAKKQSEWWQPPQFDPQWEQAFDQNGNLKPGFDQTIPSKLAKYREFQRNMLNNLTQDPIKTLAPGLEGLVQQTIEKALQTHLGGYRQEQMANDYVNQNSKWLYQQDEQGMIKTGQNGSRVLSREGMLFKTYAEQAMSMGIRDVAEQYKYAERCLEGDLMRAWIENNKSKIAAEPPKPSGGVNRIAAVGGKARKDAESGEFPKGTSLKARISESFKQNGISDKDFSQK